MGTINYCTSKYITMGYRPVSLWDLENDEYFMEEMTDQCEEYGGTIENAIRDYITECEEEAYYNAEDILERYDFHFFPVRIECGYYEGFSFMIDDDLPADFDDDQEKEEALEELKAMAEFLKELADVGIVSVWPGWCTTYRDYNETMEDVKEAVEKMLKDVQATDVYREEVERWTA